MARNGKKNIEEEFFDIDKKSRLANINIEFERPSDIFDVNYHTKKPILSDDFMDWIDSAFDLVPTKYNINISITFKHSEGYTKKELSNIFNENLKLDANSKKSENKSNDVIALTLMGLGLVFIVSYLLVFTIDSNSVLREFILYMSDTFACIFIWEGITLMVIQRYENTAYLKNIEKRFNSIKFNFRDEK